MLGKAPQNRSMYYYFDIDEMIPEDHILRLIHKHIDLSFIRPKVKHLYSHTGKPSIAPEVMIKMLLIGYLFNITSERKLCDEVKMHMGYRWFAGLDLNDKVPDHSTFSRNRHGRFKDSGIFQEIFDEIVKQCIEQNFVSGKHLTVDGTYVKANASMKNMEPIEVKMGPQEFIKKVEKENPVDEPWEPDEDFKNKGQKVSNKTHRSSTDSDSRIARKHGKGSELCHSAHYLMDNRHRIIIGVKADTPDRGAELRAGLEMIREAKWKYRLKPETIGADKGYGTGEFVQGIIEERITPHIPIPDYRSKNEIGIFPFNSFTFDQEQNVFICPEGKKLKYNGIHNSHRRVSWRAKHKDCCNCPRKAQCTKDTSRTVSIHFYQNEIDFTKSQYKTAAYRVSQRKRKLIEGLFGEAKEYMGLRKAKFRRLWNVAEQFLLTATAQNIKKMARMMGKGRKIAETLRKRMDVLFETPILLSEKGVCNFPGIQISNLCQMGAF
ncbi:MAG: IS1182 family transposase [Smithella sp.]|nr:IS1182 family transposase [Smithella sp.]